MQFQAHQIDHNILTFLADALQTLGEEEAMGPLLRKVAKVLLGLPSTLKVPILGELIEIDQIIGKAWKSLPPTYSLFKGSMTEEALKAKEKSSNIRPDYSGLFVACRDRGPCLYRRRLTLDPVKRRTRLLFLGRDNACRNALFKFLEDEKLYQGPRASTITLNEVTVFDRLRNQLCLTEVEMEVIKKEDWRPAAPNPNDSPVFSVLSFKITEQDDFDAAWKEVYYCSTNPLECNID
jgi:hypothetical protein